MTEEGWLACTDPSLMVEFLLGEPDEEESYGEDGPVVLRRYPQFRSSDRKLRLWACACCRSVWTILTDERSRAAVEFCECWVDRLAKSDEVEHIREEAFAVCRPDESGKKNWPAKAPALLFEDDLGALHDVAIVTAIFATQRGFPSPEQSNQCSLLRDLANPFRLVTLDPSWLTSTVIALARQQYESRDFSAMPILADALEDAGCDNADILNHCWADGPHVRGCFVVDLLLGKE